LETVLASWVFRNPLSIVFTAEERLDELDMRMIDAARSLLAEARQKLAASYEQIVRIEPHRLMGHKRDELNKWENRVDRAIKAIINDRRIQLTAQANRLAGLNPKSVLQRGYSITTNKETGSLVKTLEDIQIGDYLITELTDENLIESKVTKK